MPGALLPVGDTEHKPHPSEQPAQQRSAVRAEQQLLQVGAGQGLAGGGSVCGLEGLFMTNMITPNCCSVPCFVFPENQCWWQEQG